MSSKIAEESTRSERLREDYKGAFEEWAMQVNRLQEISSSPTGSTVIEEAEARVSAAEIVYRDSRDRLTDDMEHSSKAGASD